MSRLSCLILFTAVSLAMPPLPGMYDPMTHRSVTTDDPAPVFPEWFGKPGPNRLAGYDYCETVTILMQFPDNRADTLKRSPARFDSMLYSTGVYNGQAYRQGSLNDFFLENSYGAYDVRGGIAGNRWFLSSYNYSRYYDGNYMLSTGYTLARENVQQVDPYVDFSQFDLNQDGHIDALFMVHAGADGADNGSVNSCWSHAIPGFNYTTNDGVVIDGVTNVPEFAMVTPARETTMCCIAVMCHELGHLVGLPDLYDGSRNDWGPGYWSLMSYGAWGAGGNTPWSPSHMDAWCKDEAGFVTPIVLTRDTFALKILPVETHPQVFKAWRNGVNSDTCFYLENREQKGFDSPIPGPGLAIWHFDRGAGSWWNRVDLEEDSTYHLDSGFGYRPDPHVYHQEMGDTSDVLPGNWNRTAFDNTTKPNSKARNGSATNVAVRDIRQVGDTIICNVTFGLTDVAEPRPAPAVRVTSVVPNPALDWAEVSLSFPTEIRLYDAAGTLLGTVGTSGTTTRLNLTGLNPGVYLVKAGNSSRKFVKTR